MSDANFQFEAEIVDPLLCIVKKPYTVYRTTGNGRRYYFRKTDDNAITFYPSVTTILRAMMPTPVYLQQWKASKGWDAANEIARQAALKGTLMHMILSRFLLTGSVDLDSVDETIKQYRTAEKIDFDTSEWSQFMKKSILSFAQFCIDVNLSPVAVEIPLTSDKGFAGCIDIVAEMDVPVSRGKQERMRVIVDMKSGHVESDEYAVQTHAYKILWNDTFPDMPITRTYCWAPKDWISKFSYTLKEHTDAKWNEVDFYRCLSGYVRHYPPTPPDIKRITGQVKLGSTPEANLIFVSAEEAAQARLASPVSSVTQGGDVLVNGPINQYFSPEQIEMLGVFKKLFAGVPEVQNG